MVFGLAGSVGDLLFCLSAGVGGVLLEAGETVRGLVQRTLEQPGVYLFHRRDRQHRGRLGENLLARVRAGAGSAASLASWDSELSGHGWRLMADRG